ncbi:putative diphosphate--fructose-6-phosphate 1-phosphotransferase [Helianthus anomalus]
MVLMNYSHNQTQGSTVYGFQGDPAGIFNFKYLILTHEFVNPHRNQMLDLDGIVVIGGDDSNTNACLLAENLRDIMHLDLFSARSSFYDVQIYSEMIGNLMVNARSTGKYSHLVRLIGRAASHITLECALQTHPNIAIIGEEDTYYITNIVCKRADAGYNYGIILISEDLIDFIPEVQLMAELNEIIAHDVIDQGGSWKKKLRS